jgi:formamidopyrimidine-DNA glycosylase
VPELPEVETIRRQVAPHVVGHVIERLEVLDPRWCLPLSPEAVTDAVAGRRVEALSRRGKYFDWVLADDIHLLMHLRMTGTLLYDPPPDTPYSRVVMGFDDGHELWFCDPRRFGTGELMLGTPARDAFFATRVGLEPLDGELTGPALAVLARGRRAPVKAFLLDQRRVAGVGNIYADEALFSARIHPLRPAGSLRRAQYDELARAVVDTLNAGIDAGGSTIDDFRHPDGVSGSFQHDFRVHLREGEPCVVCGTPIVKMVVGGRGTYVCEHCQPRPRRRRQAASSSSRPASSASSISRQPPRTSPSITT